MLETAVANFPFPPGPKSQIYQYDRSCLLPLKLFVTKFDKPSGCRFRIIEKSKQYTSTSERRTSSVFQVGPARSLLLSDTSYAHSLMMNSISSYYHYSTILSVNKNRWPTPIPNTRLRLSPTMPLSDPQLLISNTSTSFFCHINPVSAIGTKHFP